MTVAGYRVAAARLQGGGGRALVLLLDPGGVDLVIGVNQLRLVLPYDSARAAVEEQLARREVQRLARLRSQPEPTPVSATGISLTCGSINRHPVR